MTDEILAGRVKETVTATVGTGTFTLAGAVSGFRPFSAAVADGETVLYYAEHQTLNEFEWGIGTVGGSGTTLARTTVIGGSSGAGVTVNFSAGTITVGNDVDDETLITMRAGADAVLYSLFV